MKKVLIIGAGFCGVSIAARLLRQQHDTPMTVYLLNGNGRIARGMAYGTQSREHTLNVPAGNMTAFGEDPDHFLRYAHEYDHGIAADSFVSRRMYGDYLEWLLNQAEQSALPGVELKRIYRNVTRIAPLSADYMRVVTLDSSEEIAVDQIVLALGHFPSQNPQVDDVMFYDSERYIRDPWDHARLDAIPARSPVLLLGTGLTAVDVAMTLLSRDSTRPITAVSRRGLLPQYHRHTAGKPRDAGAKAIWGDALTVRAQLRGLRQYCRAIAEDGRDWREGLALLRPITGDIWAAYPQRERKRFLRHVQPYWDTHRHRLAPAVAERFGAALARGAVRTMAARVSGFVHDGGAVRVALKSRGRDDVSSFETQYVINCTGPCSDPRQVDNALVRQLLGDGMIRADPLGLGIDVAADCAVVSSDGRVSDTLFYIGPWLKAHYWEATAVPDLRGFAQRLAERLIKD